MRLARTLMYSVLLFAAAVHSAALLARAKLMMLPTGSPIWNLRDAPHAGFKVVGDTPLVLLTVHVVDKDKPVYEYLK